MAKFSFYIWKANSANLPPFCTAAGAYVYMDAYKCDVIALIKMGACIHGVFKLCGCILSWFYVIWVYVPLFNVGSTVFMTVLDSTSLVLYHRILTMANGTADQLLLTFHRMGILLFMLPPKGVITRLLSCYYKQEQVWIRRWRWGGRSVKLCYWIAHLP